MSLVSPGNAADKRAAVQAMFDRIAGQYDRMNVLMTGGLDRRWRRLAVADAALPAGGLALDVGTGTGDLALALAESAPGARVVGLDYSAGMVRRAPAKAARSPVGARTVWAIGDGQRLPFANDTFDAVTSAFVLRNFVDLRQALAEMERVIRPGGRVVALEIAPDAAPAWRLVFEPYFHRVVPIVGRMVAGDASAYRYLPKSVAAFLDAPSVARLMTEVGLEPLPARRLVFGSVAIHRAVKPGS